MDDDESVATRLVTLVYATFGLRLISTHALAKTGARSRNN